MIQYLTPKKYVICDIDNCIADDRHRIHLIKDHPSGLVWAKYHLYHLACINDKPDFIPEMRTPNIEVHFISGMPEDYRSFRLRWFLQHGKKPGKSVLHLRPSAQSGRQAVDVKRDITIELLAKVFNPEDVLACYDDRREIVEMYKELGLPGVHRAIHDEEFLYNATGP